MIDIENDVFTYLATILRTAYPGIFVAGEYVETPASFPAVTIVEADNSVDRNMRSDTIENAVKVMYEINVYSNKSAGKKQEAKKIAATVCDAMNAKGFIRKLRQHIPNMLDSSIHRIVIRYDGTIGRDGNNAFLVYQQDY